MNFTESDGQTLALCNRENWQIHEETEAGTEELNYDVFSDSSPEQKQQAEENAWLINKLIAFCIGNWNNAFMQGLKEDMEIQRRRIEGWRLMREQTGGKKGNEQEKQPLRS